MKCTFLFCFLTVFSGVAAAQTAVRLDGVSVIFPPGWMTVVSNSENFPEYAFYQFVHANAGHSLSVEIRTHEDEVARRSWMQDFIHTKLAHIESIQPLDSAECEELLRHSEGMIVSSEHLNYRSYVLYASERGRDYRIIIGGRANLFEPGLPVYQQILSTIRFPSPS